MKGGKIKAVKRFVTSAALLLDVGFSRSESLGGCRDANHQLARDEVRPSPTRSLTNRKGKYVAKPTARLPQAFKKARLPPTVERATRFPTLKNPRLSPAFTKPRQSLKKATKSPFSRQAEVTAAIKKASAFKKTEILRSSPSKKAEGSKTGKPKHSRKRSLQKLRKRRGTKKSSSGRKLKRKNRRHHSSRNHRSPTIRLSSIEGISTPVVQAASPSSPLMPLLMCAVFMGDKKSATDAPLQNKQTPQEQQQLAFLPSRTAHPAVLDLSEELDTSDSVDPSSSSQDPQPLEEGLQASNSGEGLQASNSGEGLQASNSEENERPSDESQQPAPLQETVGAQDPASPNGPNVSNTVSSGLGATVGQPAGLAAPQSPQVLQATKGLLSTQNLNKQTTPQGTKPQQQQGTSKQQQQQQQGYQQGPNQSSGNAAPSPPPFDQDIEVTLELAKQFQAAGVLENWQAQLIQYVKPFQQFPEAVAQGCSITWNPEDLPAMKEGFELVEFLLGDSQKDSKKDAKTKLQRAIKSLETIEKFNPGLKSSESSTTIQQLKDALKSLEDGRDNLIEVWNNLSLELTKIVSLNPPSPSASGSTGSSELSPTAASMSSSKLFIEACGSLRVTLLVKLNEAERFMERVALNGVEHLRGATRGLEGVVNSVEEINKGVDDFWSKYYQLEPVWPSVDSDKLRVRNRIVEFKKRMLAINHKLHPFPSGFPSGPRHQTGHGAQSGQHEQRTESTPSRNAPESPSNGRPEFVKQRRHPSNPETVSFASPEASPES